MVCKTNLLKVLPPFGLYSGAYIGLFLISIGVLNAMRLQSSGIAPKN